MDESTRPAFPNNPAEPALEGQPAPAGPDAGPAAPPRRKRSLWLIGGLALLVIVLAAAAFVGGRLLNRPPAGAAAGKAGSGMRMMLNNGSGSRMFQVEPARELPQTTPDLRGVLTQRQDNSLFVGTGSVMRMVKKDSSGTQASAPTYDGPVLEAVVTHDTQIFRDETNMAPPTDPSGKIQQVVKPGSLDEITANSMIQVWGEKTGQRTIARILVYQPG